jgi:DNA/RNA-binding domain of Phe-tRNA-synthetase-like protein
MITLSDSWKGHKPRAKVGLLYLAGVPNSHSSPDLAAAREELEKELRERYSDLDRSKLRELPVFSAYDSFYRGFRKTYHVQLQLESVIFKGKSIYSPSALVGCMFMAELKTGLLTAGHDHTDLSLPLVADIAAGGESYQRMDGSTQQLKEEDLYVRDRQGILSSVIYGPDQRTQIKQNTRSAVFTTYGPPGISGDMIQEQLEILEGYARLIAPGLTRGLLEVL